MSLSGTSHRLMERVPEVGMTCTGTELGVNKLSEMQLLQASTPSSNEMKAHNKDASPDRCVCARLTHRRLFHR